MIGQNRPMNNHIPIPTNGKVFDKIHAGSVRILGKFHVIEARGHMIEVCDYQGGPGSYPQGHSSDLPSTLGGP